LTRAFIDRLSAPRALALRRKGFARVDFVDATKGGARAAAALGLDARRLEFRMMDVHDPEGLSVRFRIPYADLNECVDEIRRAPEFTQWLERHGRDRLGFYLAKSVATSSSTDHNVLWRSLYLLQVFAWTLRREGGREAAAFLESSPWSELLAPRARRDGLELHALGRPPLAAALREAAVRGLGRGRLGSWLRSVRAHGLSGAAMPRGPGSAPDRPPRLAAEYFGQLNLDRPELQSDLFFWQASPLRKRGALLLFQAHSDPLRRDYLEELKAHGLEGLALSPAAAKDPSMPVYVPPPLAAAPARREGPGTLGSWLKAATSAYDDQRAYWRELFERKGVRVFAGWYSNDPSHAPMADALRDLGGVHAAYQRSYECLPSWVSAANTDIHFVWGPNTARPDARDGSAAAYTIATGYLGDHRFAALKPRALELRAKLEARGARRVIALFDENSLPDHRWHVGHERLKLGYAFVLEKLLADPTLGLIIKPKVASSIRKRLAPLDGLLAAAEKTGRCFVFEGGRIHSSHPPAAAALAADLAVHTYLVAGSAAIEAALAGVPTAILDYDGFPQTPLNRLGNKTVFKDWPSLWPAFESRAQGLGDWSAMLPELDPFRDGRAAERMGTFLEWILEALESGKPREKAMEEAAERYAARWGAAHVWKR
jgi:hypothetical protein